MLLDEVASAVANSTAETLARDEVFWSRFASGYDCDPGFVQLNYGYYHPALRAVLDVELETARALNRRGAHFKVSESEPLLESTRRELAGLAGASAEEIVITRNASEALNIIIAGYPLRAGDEIMASDQDYTAVTQALDQRAQSDSVVIKRVSVPLDPASDEQIIEAFQAAISPRTRLLVLTHMIHFTGHILPAAKPCKMAREQGIAVVLDAAHSFAQVEFSVRDLGCEFMAASLHKWLGAPLGTGVLYVKKSEISKIRPLFADTVRAVDDVRRLERFGNRPDSLNAGLREAVRWHHVLTTAVKRARLSHLHRSWAEPLRARSRFRVLTPRAPERHGAIGLVALEGVSGDSLAKYLYERHQLFVAAHALPNLTGVRITPGLPTSVSQIERLSHALIQAEKDLG